MLPTRANTHNITWMEPQQPSQEEHPPLATWTNININNVVGTDPINDEVPSFKSILQSGWYMNSAIHHDLPNLSNHNETNRDIGFSSNPNSNFLMQPLDSSPHAPSFTQQSCFTPFFTVNSNNHYESTFDFGSESEFLTSNSPVLMGFNAQPQMRNLELSSNHEFNATRAVELGGGINQMGVVEQPFDGSGSSNALFSNNANVLQPIEVFNPLEPQLQSPTLFEKRCQGSSDELGALEVPAMLWLQDISEERELEEGLNYDSDEVEVGEIDKLEENGNNGGNNLNANINDNDNDNVDAGVNGGYQKGKKKGMPARNLMAERHRRKKLSDRLYMLRSVVPRISKMDRASILGDAIEYLKELLQRVNDLQKEMESISLGSSLPPSTSFNSMTPTLPTLPSWVKEELRPNSFLSHKTQSPKVEVKVREGRAINIHMFCPRKPGLFLSTMRALDVLGLDIQQAVISCFNGFALDVFRAEQFSEGPDLHPEQIKAVLLDIAGFH